MQLMQALEFITQFRTPMRCIFFEALGHSYRAPLSKQVWHHKIETIDLSISVSDRIDYSISVMLCILYVTLCIVFCVTLSMAEFSRTLL